MMILPNARQQNPVLVLSRIILAERILTKNKSLMKSQLDPERYSEILKFAEAHADFAMESIGCGLRVMRE